jgi:Putative beta-barrel porin-2, OmpL-like. bbp2
MKKSKQTNLTTLKKESMSSRKLNYLFSIIVLFAVLPKTSKAQFDSLNVIKTQDATAVISDKPVNEKLVYTDKTNETTSQIQLLNFNGSKEKNNQDKKKLTVLKRADKITGLTDTVTTPPYTEPFAFGDFSWLMGANRQKNPPPFGNSVFTPDITIDVNYTHSFNNPIDNTVVGSTALARNNEVQLSYLGIGGDFHWQNVRGRFMSQWGTRSTVVPRNDISSYKGQYDLQTIYRYISEAYAGYHWDKWHGINLDFGIFMSYIGLFSYNNFENWSYQPSYTSDNTPWFFNGMRLQTFPTDKLKLEFWLINGWQTYGKFNKMPGFGFSVYYRPKEYVDWVTNNYFGKDDQDAPGRIRVHTDNSFLLRYYNQPKKKQGITRAAFSSTLDFGFEDGEGVSGFKGTAAKPLQQFFSGMVYNRLWFGEKWAWTLGGGFMKNPGQYLILAPTGYADTLFQNQTGPGSNFNAWDASTTLDYMPNEYITWRLEYVHRYAKATAAPGTTPLNGYFAGPGGVTSPDGYTTGNGLPFTYTSSGASVAPPLSALGGWMPDLRNNENRIVLAVLVRF